MSDEEDVELKFDYSPRVFQKLKSKHGVTEKEFRECFNNSDGKSLEDKRPDHISNPITLWFIALTDSGRELKICYMLDDDTVCIKTAYPPNDEEKRIFKKYA